MRKHIGPARTFVIKRNLAAVKMLCTIEAALHDVVSGQYDLDDDDPLDIGSVSFSRAKRLLPFTNAAPYGNSQAVVASDEI